MTWKDYLKSIDIATINIFNLEFASLFTFFSMRWGWMTWKDYLKSIDIATINIFNLEFASLFTFLAWGEGEWRERIT